MSGIGGAAGFGSPTPRQLEKMRGGLGDRVDNRPQIGLQTALKLRVVKHHVIEHLRRLRIELFQTTSAAALEQAMSAWLASHDETFDVLEIHTEVSTCFNEDNNTTVFTFMGRVLYAPDDDRATFQQAISDWFLAGGEKDFIEMHVEHTDRMYRAHILYAE